jgi:signal peptidase I
MVTSSAAARVMKASIRWLVRLVLLAFALVVVGALTIVIVLPRATHGSALTVLTGSMTPEIPVGSVVLVRPVDPSTLHVGDIATYQVAPGKPEFITHRIVKIDPSTSPTSFTFKGDANRGADFKLVPAGAIRGEVWFHVPYLGAIRDALHGKGGISLVAMLVLAGYALSQLSGAFKDRKTKNVAAGAQRTTVDDDGEQRLHIDRTLIRVAFSTESVEEQTRMTPQAAAEHWSALLVDFDEETFTVLVAPPPEGAVAAVELLMYLNPISIEVCEPPNALVGAPAGAEVLAVIRSRVQKVSDSEMEPDHAVG